MKSGVTTILYASPTEFYVYSAMTMDTPAFPELVSCLTEVCNSLERVLAYKYKLTM